MQFSSEIEVNDILQFGGVCHDLAADSYLRTPIPFFYDDAKENKSQPLLLSLSRHPTARPSQGILSTNRTLNVGRGTGEQIGVNQRASWDTRFQVERDIYKDARALATIRCCCVTVTFGLGLSLCKANNSIVGRACGTTYLSVGPSHEHNRRFLRLGAGTLAFECWQCVQQQLLYS